MRVLLQPQVNNLKYIQSKQTNYAIQPTKTDSVSFTSKETFLQELLETLPKVKGHAGQFNFIESSKYTSDVDVQELVKTSVEVLGSRFNIIKRTAQSENLFGIGKVETKYYIRKDAEKHQFIKHSEYENLVAKLKEFAIPTILEKHGFGEKNIEETLENISEKFALEQNKLQKSSVYQEEYIRLNSISLPRNKRSTISLIYNHNFAITKLGFTSPDETLVDIITITNPKEIAAFKNVVALGENIINKKTILDEEKTLEGIFKKAEKALLNYREGMAEKISKADEKIEKAMAACKPKSN